MSVTLRAALVVLAVLHLLLCQFGPHDSHPPAAAGHSHVDTCDSPAVQSAPDPELPQPVSARVPAAQPYNALPSPARQDAPPRAGKPDLLTVVCVSRV